jgi:putative membrane protein
MLFHLAQSVATITLSDAPHTNTGLIAFLCFSGRLIYPSYALVDRPFGLDALQDQIAARAFMWVFGSPVFLTRAICLTARFLANDRLIDEKTGLERPRAMAW